jgi:Arc/MetJ-type ribon-helix-helix transcriptional regulator
MNTNEQEQEICKSKNINLRIGEKFFERINKHVYLLKRLESRSHSKQRWIEEAIKEKLDTEEKCECYIPKDKFISLKIPDYLYRRIENRIEHAKKFNISYSATKWLVEAILDKLDREDEKAKQLMKQVKDLIQKP